MSRVFQSPSPDPPAPDLPTPLDSPPDPFGQTGVRQYFGRILGWLCLTVALCAGAMWYRSQTFADRFDWRGKDQVLSIRSVYGRLQITGATLSTGGGGGSGWSYRGGYFRGARDLWQPSPWKTIGFEVGRGGLDRNATGGFWIRVKWYFVAGIFTALPILRWVVTWRRSRDDAE